MAHIPLRLGGVAAACLMALTAPVATAAPCPRSTDQSFSGLLLPGETDVIPVTVTLRGNVSFQFVPASPFWDPFGQRVSMAVAGTTMTGTGSLAITLVQAAPGLYEVHLRGHVLGMDGMAALPYRLLVTQRNCQP